MQSASTLQHRQGRTERGGEEGGGAARGGELQQELLRFGPDQHSSETTSGVGPGWEQLLLLFITH